MQQPSWREVVFSIKTFGAAMLALYIAFRLNLTQPSWAMLTALIVSQPIAGMGNVALHLQEKFLTLLSMLVSIHDRVTLLHERAPAVLDSLQPLLYRVPICSTGKTRSRPIHKKASPWRNSCRRSNGAFPHWMQW
ncbi:FUSC family protein [Microvirga sp. 2MCAF38]|uniref:FUSC family protein n=1 Tax=Microvirga sp. 2MCAF38 TaxID=3232989 RepID=UPI003F9AA403